MHNFPKTKSPPLRDEHGALAEDVGVDGAVARRRDDLALDVPQHLLQRRPRDPPEVAAAAEVVGRCLQGVPTLRKITTEFPFPSCREVRRIIFREFPCPAWALASCSSGPQAGELPKT